MTPFTYENVYRAYLECRRSKRKTANALAFEMNLEENIRLLTAELASGRYSPGRSVCFVVTEPSPREIFAAEFRDRIVHHLFVRELLPMAERMFTFDSFACRVGKGTHKAVARLRSYQRKVTVNFRNRAWYLKLDIAGFFMAIDHTMLYRLVLAMIGKHTRSKEWKQNMSTLARILIFHKPGENYWRKGKPELAKLIPPHKSLLSESGQRGLPIGNYSSQFFANVFLNVLDHYIKRVLRCRYYVRYVDDVVLLSREKEALETYQRAIASFLRTYLGMSLNTKKTVLQPLGQGIDFLGYFLKEEQVYPRRTVQKRYTNKLFHIVVSAVSVPWQQSRALAASYRGHSEYFHSPALQPSYA